MAEPLTVTISSLFRCHCDEATSEFLDVFGRMVDWWLSKASSGFESHTALRNRFYEAAKKTWFGWNSQHLETSSSLAYLFLKRGAKQHALKLAVVGSQAVSIKDLCLHISLCPPKFGRVTLNVENSQQHNLLKAAEDRMCKLGQVLLTTDWVLITFIFEVSVGHEQSGIIDSLFDKPEKDVLEE